MATFSALRTPGSGQACPRGASSAPTQAGAVANPPSSRDGSLFSFQPAVVALAGGVGEIGHRPAPRRSPFGPDLVCSHPPPSAPSPRRGSGTVRPERRRASRQPLLRTGGRFVSPRDARGARSFRRRILPPTSIPSGAGKPLVSPEISVADFRPKARRFCTRPSRRPLP